MILVSKLKVARSGMGAATFLDHQKNSVMQPKILASKPSTSPHPIISCILSYSASNVLTSASKTAIDLKKTESMSNFILDCLWVELPDVTCNKIFLHNSLTSYFLILVTLCISRLAQNSDSARWLTFWFRNLGEHGFSKLLHDLFVLSRGKKRRIQIYVNEHNINNSQTAGSLSPTPLAWVCSWAPVWFLSATPLTCLALASIMARTPPKELAPATSTEPLASKQVGKQPL